MFYETSKNEKNRVGDAIKRQQMLFVANNVSVCYWFSGVKFIERDEVWGLGRTMVVLIAEYYFM